MRNLLNEQGTVWERLIEAQKPVILYGMGDGADKIMRVCALKGITISDIFASDEFVRGHSFRGFRVLKFSQILEKYDDFIILVAFGVHDTKTMERLYDLSCRYELYAPDVPVVGDGLFDLKYLDKHEDELRDVYNQLADEQSRRVFLNSLEYKISGKIEYLKACETTQNEMYHHLIIPRRDEVYIDLGAYDGDTILEFLMFSNQQYERLIALEPDHRNFKKLCRNTDTLSIERIHAGAWSEDGRLRFDAKAGRNSKLEKNGAEVAVRSVDSILQGARASYIKFDVEGAEREALIGAGKTIRRYKPRLFVAAYHRNEDLFDLPNLILSLNPEYKLYLRHYPYIPAWETNIIAL